VIIFIKEMGDLGDDTVTILACLAVLVFYHLCFYFLAFKSNNGSYFQLSRNLRNAVNWLIKHEEKQDAATVTLAIQTLRNTILVAIFTGGQSFVYATNALLALKSKASPTMNDFLQTGIISSCLFLSFLNWANVIRYASHLGFLIGSFDVSKRYETKKSIEDGLVGQPASTVAVPTEEYNAGVIEGTRLVDVMHINFR
jgi:hypothetical protein